jgi:putative spermidine/putrescine transport system substrate-binding protein
LVAADRLGRAAVALAVVIIATACAAPAASPSVGIDRAAAAEQARTFHTIATGDDWANYGEQFSRFCEVTFGFDCNRPERDLTGGSMSSAEEVQVWVAERNNPQSVLADIGILFIPQAEQVGVLADYEPPNAGLLPDDLHGPGWVATFAGVPTILVNTDVLAERNVPVPESWADLADPRYAGMIGLTRVGVGASSTWAFIAMNLALGGTLEDWQPGIELGRQLLPNLTQQASIETFERGEVPISVRFDFQHAAWLPTFEEHGVHYRHVMPSDGSALAPATLMMNRYDTAHHDFAKLFMEWVLTDEGQALFAPFAARPIRTLVGDQPVEVPSEYRTYWLPDAEYERVRQVDWRKIDSDLVREIWENDVVGGG